MTGAALQHGREHHLDRHENRRDHERIAGEDGWQTIGVGDEQSGEDVGRPVVDEQGSDTPAESAYRTPPRCGQSQALTGISLVCHRTSVPRPL